MSSSLAALVRRLTPVIAAVAIFASILQLLGYQGLDVLGDIFRGSLGGPNAALQSLRWSLPLTIMGLGAAISFRTGFFNVGGLGQFYFGAIAATAVATNLVGVSPLVAIPASVLAAMLAGALWSLLPGVLRVYWGADEVVTTIMANFVAQFLMLYLLSGPMMDRSSATAQGAASAPIAAEFRISTSSGISAATVLITLLVIAAVWLLATRTSFGVLSAIAGRNGIMLAWQGVRVKRIGLQAFGVSGALAGLAGAMEILGPSGKLVAGLSPQLGNNAMLVALVAGLAIFGSVFAALFFGALTAASLFLPIASQLPASAVVVLNGLIAILVTAQFRFSGRSARRRSRSAVESVNSPGDKAGARK